MSNGLSKTLADRIDQGMNAEILGKSDRLLGATAVVLLLLGQAIDAAAALKWNQTTQKIKALAFATNVSVTFFYTNTTQQTVQLVRIRPSCGCTVPAAGRLPKEIQPGAVDKITFKTDISGKSGTLNKGALIRTTDSAYFLNFSIEIPPMDPMRSANRTLAKADPQAIFRGDCAQCHAEPALGKHGKELYRTACGICHDAEHRASMVPDLRKHPLPNTREAWVQLITHGKPDTLMPGFALEHNGPLTAAQINSLADFMATNFQSEADASGKSHLNPR